MNLHPLTSDKMQKSEMSVSEPFFSIGVTTYNRKELLKQTLTSIINQTFTDFEVIVGNDYIGEVLDADVLGIEDPRIRFINHECNLGELNNMNALLAAAKGKYFTWQFDDDLYAPELLEFVFNAIKNFNSPLCIYTSYAFICGTSFPEMKKSHRNIQIFSGPEFLHLILSKKIKAVGCCGVFEIDSLRKMGGTQQLCKGKIGLHFEHLLIVKAGLFRQVAYIKAPLVLIRDYNGSWSASNNEIDCYKEAGRNLVCESLMIFQTSSLIKDFKNNLYAILKLSTDILASKLIARDGHLNKKEIKEYLLSIEDKFSLIKDLDLRRIALFIIDTVEKERRLWVIIKARFKRKAPNYIDQIVRMIRSFLSCL